MPMEGRILGKINLKEETSRTLNYRADTPTLSSGDCSPLSEKTKPP
jgi:hypothetical protein